MGMLKNFVAIFFGVLLVGIFIFGTEFALSLYRMDPKLTHAKNDLPLTPPPESYGKNPDPNVPEDFIISYPGVFTRFYEEGVEERSDFQIWNNYDDDLGSVNGKNITVRHQLRKGKSYIFNVKYKTDQFGRRITPVEGSGKRKKFLIYFGCSFIWGSCLSDTETIPYLVSKLAPEFQPYNYGRGASGTNYLLALLQNRQLPAEVAQKEGLGIYVFINDHVERSVGDVFNTASMFFMPYFEYQNGELVRNGSFATGRPWTTKFYRALYSSNIFKSLNRSFPRMGEKEFRLTCDLIEKSKERFLETFPKSDFYVLFHPVYSSYSAQMIPCLKEKKIKFLDYQGVLDGSAMEKYIIPYDHHPNALANEIIAKKLVEDLKLNE